MAGREQALVQVIHAFIAAGARFFKVPFGQADRGDRPELNFRWSATMPSEQITPVTGINDRTIKGGAAMEATERGLSLCAG